MKVTCRCIANVDGCCHVSDCKGELREIGGGKRSAEERAKEYESVTTFIDYLRRKERS